MDFIWGVDLVGDDGHTALLRHSSPTHITAEVEKERCASKPQAVRLYYQDSARLIVTILSSPTRYRAGDLEKCSYAYRVKKTGYLLETSQPSVNSDSSTKQLNTHVDLTNTAPRTGEDFETEFAAWSAHQAELQSPLENSNSTNTFSKLDNFGAVDNDRASLDLDDGLAYLAAYNATHPLPGDTSFQGAAFRDDALLYDDTVEASQESNTVRDQDAISDHRGGVTSSSQPPHNTGYKSPFGAESSESAEPGSYAHYLQNVDDQTDFSEFLHAPFKDQSAIPSAATKRASQTAFDGGEDQYGKVFPNKRVRRSEPATSEEPADVLVNSLLRGNTAPRTSNGRGPRRP